MKNNALIFLVVIFSVLTWLKGELLNYILKCNRSKSIKCSICPPPQMIHKDEKFPVTNSGYRGHLGVLALLGIPPENAALEVKAGAPPGGGPTLPLGRTPRLTENKLSEARTYRTAITSTRQGKKLSNFRRA